MQRGHSATFSPIMVLPVPLPRCLCFFFRPNRGGHSSAAVPLALRLGRAQWLGTKIPFAGAPVAAKFCRLLRILRVRTPQSSSAGAPRPKPDNVPALTLESFAFYPASVLETVSPSPLSRRCAWIRAESLYV